MANNSAYFVSILVLLGSAQTLSFPTNGSFIPITNAEGFELCTKLNLAGCGVTTIDPFIRGFLNDQIQSAGYNYSLPLDPCEFDTINMSWILSIIDNTVLTYITADQVLNVMPCQIYIQMPAFLSSKAISAIATDSYWFGSTGHCLYNESRVVDCSDPNRTIANYTSADIGLECFYPFVPSHYETPFEPLYDAGLTHCGVSCHYIPYMGDIKHLDDFNYASSMIALIFGIAFFINTSFEFHKAYKSKHSFSDLPLTFDIPVIIAIWMVILTILLAIPSWIGKEYFSCEIGTEAQVIIPSRETNIHCYVAGQFTLLGIHSIYLYNSLLAFAVWRSVANPWAPLFKIHKKWYHLGIHIVILGQYIGAMSEDIFTANSMSGICGPNVVGDWGVRYLLVPLSVHMASFILFITLSIYKIWHHVRYQHQHSDAEKAIAQLAIRLVVYSAFVASSLACFLYISIRFVQSGDDWKQDLQDHIQCYTDNVLLGQDEECVVDLSIEDDVYWMQGLVLLFLSVASFVLSCTNQRYNDYAKMKALTKRKIENIVKINSASISKVQSKSMTSIGTLEKPESTIQSTTKDETKDERSEVVTVVSSETQTNEETEQSSKQGRALTYFKKVSSMESVDEIEMRNRKTM
eukprot:650917_1